jgi:hypothetical protein
MGNHLDELENASNAPASNSAAVVTLAAPGDGLRHHLRYVSWSYNADPTAGRLTITGLNGGQTWSVDVTKGGPGALPLPPLSGELNTAVVVTLAAGGSGVTGKVNVSYHTAAAWPKLR